MLLGLATTSRVTARSWNYQLNWRCIVQRLVGRQCLGMLFSTTRIANVGTTEIGALYRMPGLRGINPAAGVFQVICTQSTIPLFKRDLCELESVILA